MVKKETVYFLAFVVVFSFFLVPFISAGFFDSLKSRFPITGFATQQDTNASITIVGANRVNITVNNGTLTGSGSDATENSVSNLVFYVTVRDVDGASDVNRTSVRANFTKNGEPLRENSSCVYIADIDALSANFSCTIQMWYFDSSGIWNITVGATDLGNATFVYNTSTVFQYNQLQAIQIHPRSLTWASVSPGATNQTSTNDPTTINNTGNYNIPNITVYGLNLYGQSDTSLFLGVANFTVANNTGSSSECDYSLANNATALVNGTNVQIKQTNLSRGNNSVNNNQTGQEQIFYCIPTVPTSISSQTYSTTLGGAWQVKIT